MNKIYFLKAAVLALAAMLTLNSALHATGKENTAPGTHKFKLTHKRALVYLTAKNTDDRLSEKDSPEFSALLQPDENFPTIMIDPDKQFQEIEGFGGALTDASAETFYKLPEDKQNEILEAYFSTENGIGYSLCRTHINSCDFSSESYAYTEVVGDTALNHFTVGHDLKYRIPMIKAALQKSGGKMKLFASPWSPPAWMKTNNNMLQGGKVRPEYLNAWAKYYIRFMEEYEKHGVPIWGLTVQNEPMSVQTWESCIFTGDDEREFVKNHLGPVLQQSRFAGTRLMIWDHNRGIMYQRAKAVYDDPEAAKYVWGMGFHWYMGDHFENVRLVHDSYPEKKLIFTEGTPASFDAEQLDNWRWGEFYARSVINDLNNGANGWVDWNILLDERGGPNHVGNFCIAPVIGDTQTGELTYMNSYYYLGHFSKFIRPGAKRIVSSSNNDRLLTTAFINTNGQIAVVVMNASDRDLEFRTWIDGQAVQTSSPAKSIQTLVIR